MDTAIVKQALHRRLRRYYPHICLKRIVLNHVGSIAEEYLEDQVEFRLWDNCEGNALRFEVYAGDYCYSDIAFSINGMYASYGSFINDYSEEEKYQHNIPTFSKRTLYKLAKTSLMMSKQGLSMLPDSGIYYVSRFNDNHYHGFNSVIEQFGFVEVREGEYIRFPSEYAGYGGFNRFGKWLLDYSRDDCLAMALYLVKTPWLRKLTIIE